MRKFFTVLATLATLSLTNCGYNAIQSGDEQVKANWSEVVNQYQRRADLVPNLVNSVKGFAQQEKDVLLGVTNARAKVGSIQATPEVINDPAALQKFQQAQGELSSALESSPCACWNFWNAAGSFSTSGVAWMLPTFARALVTPSSTSFSCCAKPFTELTRLGTRSARRWYWFTTSDQFDLICSSSLWIAL